MSGRHSSLTVEKTLPQQRLDTYLRTQFPSVSRGTIQRLIEQGHIKVNAKEAKPTQSPVAGDVVDVFWPEARPAEAQAEEIPLTILYEDRDIIVLNKAPGLVVHPSAGHEEHTLVNALLHHCHGELSGIGGVMRPGIVHRLDKETSGCLIVAKHDAAHLRLAEQFAHRTMQKRYLAIVCGELARESGEIRAAIARHPSHRKRMAVTESSSGREAWTSYRVLERLRGAMLVEAALHTGRTHQIRVHFQHLGCPVAGDETYGKRQNSRLTELTGYQAPRVMLHASLLALEHPCTGEALEFEAPLPEDFRQAVAALRVVAD
jgi:23S rRNA pseudouridine1911/1915/1917 synthase